MQKPRFCRRFPVGLVATPHGGRVTTEHRCPCRTIGARPLLDEASVTPALQDEKGVLKADRRVKRIDIDAETQLEFAEWRTFEAGLLGRLAEGESIEEVLAADPFPPLEGATWESEGERFAVEGITDTSAFSFAVQWFLMAMEVRLDEAGTTSMARPPARPWAEAFDRAEMREGDPRTKDEVLADWVADVIWALTWTDDRTFDVARAELTTRVAIARVIADTLESDHGLNAGRAAAEAITVVELVGESELWTELVARVEL